MDNQVTTAKDPTNQGKSAAPILVVDDNAVNLLVAKATLESLGLECIEADSGFRALELVKSEALSLILMDIQMPKMDGIATLKAIRRLSHAQSVIPIIALTAQVLQQERVKIMNSGFNDYLSKPIDRDDLDRATKKWM